MTNYELFDPKSTNETGSAVTAPHTNFAQYEAYKLYMLPCVLDVKNIPLEGVRLDDMHIAIVLESGVFSKKELIT